MTKEQPLITMYLMNKKGLTALEHYLNTFDPNTLNYIIAAQDPNVEYDYYEDIKKLCEKNKVPFLERSKSNEVSNDHKNNFQIAIGWRWLIHNAKNLIVFHDSRLPKYRGFAPLVSCLINEEKELGVTALFASENYDEGDIIAQKTISINYPIKIGEAINAVIPLYGELVCQIANNILMGSSVTAIPQDNALATYSLWRDEDDYQINWYDNVQRIKRLIDAVGFPYKGASSYMFGEKVRIFSAKVYTDVMIENRSPGKVIFMKDGAPIIVCGQGLLEVGKLVDDKTGKNLLPLKKFRTRFKDS